MLPLHRFLKSQLAQIDENALHAHQCRQNLPERWSETRTYKVVHSLHEEARRNILERCHVRKPIEKGGSKKKYRRMRVRNSALAYSLDVI
jgi:hypothetical protein